MARTTPRQWPSGGTTRIFTNVRPCWRCRRCAIAGLSAEAPFSDRTRDVLLQALFASGSRLLILPLQDVIGWRDRINTPALVNDENWTWRLPGPVEDLMTDAGSLERAGFLRALSNETGPLSYVASGFSRTFFLWSASPKRERTLVSDFHGTQMTRIKRTAAGTRCDRPRDARVDDGREGPVSRPSDPYRPVFSPAWLRQLPVAQSEWGLSI